MEFQNDITRMLNDFSFGIDSWNRSEAYILSGQPFVMKLTCVLLDLLLLYAYFQFCREFLWFQKKELKRRYLRELDRAQRRDPGSFDAETVSIKGLEKADRISRLTSRISVFVGLLSFSWMQAFNISFVTVWVAGLTMAAVVFLGESAGFYVRPLKWFSLGLSVGIAATLGWAPSSWFPVQAFLLGTGIMLASFWGAKFRAKKQGGTISRISVLSGRTAKQTSPLWGKLKQRM